MCVRAIEERARILLQYQNEKESDLRLASFDVVVAAWTDGARMRRGEASSLEASSIIAGAQLLPRCCHVPSLLRQSERRRRAKLSTDYTSKGSLLRFVAGQVSARGQGRGGYIYIYVHAAIYYSYTYRRAAIGAEHKLHAHTHSCRDGAIG